jgi:hypothetical protein
MDDEQKVGLAIILLLLISALIEAGIVAYAYFTADTVMCNWLWCTFTTERTVASTRIEQICECTQNGVKVNCSNLKITDEWWNKVP